MDKPNTNDPPICATCHIRGGGCCRLSEQGVEIMFGLTNAEVAVMSRALGRPPEDFCVADQASPEFLKTVMAIHPVFGQTMPGGRRLRLRVNDEACVLLGPEGCVLPTEARPLYCRLYPFWFTPDDRLMVLGSPECLAQKNAVSWKDVLARMGQRMDDLRGLFARLRRYAAEHEARATAHEGQR